MVDQQVPTTQFHSYQPPDATPHREREMGRWEMLRKVGLKDSQIESMRNEIDNLDLQGSWTSFREYARRNPAKVLGGAAVLAIGAGLLGVMAARRRRS